MFARNVLAKLIITCLEIVQQQNWQRPSEFLESTSEVCHSDIE